MARQNKRRSQAREAAQKLDVYEAEDQLPVEEQPKNINKRYDVADGIELPSDIDDDEEIDEDMAFTEEDKVRYAGMFGDDSDGEDAEADDTNLFLDSEASDDEHMFDDEEAEPEGDSGDDARHQAMLEAVRSQDSRKRKRRDVVISEAYPESEFNLNPLSTSAGAEGQGELQLSDLIRGLGDSRKKLGAARKTLERLERRESAMAAPLPGNVQARQERKAAYEVTSKDVAKWQPLVKANREAPTLAFSAARGGSTRAGTTAALSAHFQPENELEAEVAAMLQAAAAHDGKAVQQAEEALALKALSVEESKARRERLAKMRALLFYHERKAKRLKAIKSKDYRRRVNRAARRKAGAAADEGDPEALRAAAEEAEFERAKERLTLKHRNTSKWARRAIKRGINVMDENTKEAMQEQLRLGMQLRQKVEQAQDSSSDTHSDGSTSASDEEDERTGGARSPQPEKAPYRRTRAAAAHLLQGQEGEEGASKGLFALPFMKRAAEQQRTAATQEAKAILCSIEAEVTGRPEDEMEGAAVQQGRFTFGTGFPQDAEQPAHRDNDGSDSDEYEDKEAKAERLARQRQQDAGMARLSTQADAAQRAANQTAAFSTASASHCGNGSQSTEQHPTAAAAGTAADESPAEAGGQQTNSAVLLLHSRRNARLFGSGTAADAVQLPPPQAVAVATGPVSVSQASGGNARPDDGPSQQRQQQQPTANGVTSGHGIGRQPEDDVPADVMRPVAAGQLSQKDLIAMAFAGDDVEADFAAQKAAEAEEEMPKVEGPTFMPGWGSWANPKRMQADADATHRRIKQQKEAALARRKDAGQGHVVISEKWDKKAQKYATTSVPFPFDGRDTYERSMRQPLGKDFNTDASFRNLTRPAVIKQDGLIIKPLRYSKEAPDTHDEDEQASSKKGGKGVAAKGQKAVPAKARARVRVIAGGMPRGK